MKPKRLYVAAVAVRAALLASLCVLAACPKQQAKPVTPAGALLRWKFDSGQSLVYAIQSESTGGFGGQKQKKETVKGMYYLDAYARGRALLRANPEKIIRAMELDLELSTDRNTMIFPLPPFPVTRSPRAHTSKISGLGVSSTAVVPGYAITDEVRLLGSNGKVARIAWTRRIKQTGTKKIKHDTRQQGSGTFDLAAGRYVKLRYTSKTNYSQNISGDGDPITMTDSSKVRLTLDEPLSKKRTRARQRMKREASKAARDYAAYARSHPASAELRQAVDQYLAQRSASALNFYLLANPRGLWQEGLAKHRSRADKKKFLQVMLPFMMVPVGLTGEVVDFLRSRVAQEPLLRRYVAGLADPRLKEALVRLRRCRDRSVARQAAESLKKLEARGTVKPGKLLELAADSSGFVQLGHRFVLDGEGDPRQVIGVLIQVLGKKETTKFNRQLCVQWLEGLTSRALGKDAVAWKTFWDRNKDRPVSVMLAESAREGNPLMRINALTHLGKSKPSRAGLVELLRGLKSPFARVRAAAAVGLATWRDGRAVPALLDLLEHPLSGYRQTGLAGLSLFHTTTLGFRPPGKEAARAVAVGRWRGWAAQARLPRVNPAK